MSKNKEDIVSRRAMFALELGTSLAVFMYVGARVLIGSAGYWYILPNLLLAYIPLGVTFGLVGALRRLSWKHWQTWLWAVVWLVFLPNSFYVISDAVHLTQHSYGLDPLFGQVMFGLFAVLGMLSGFVSVRSVHQELQRVMKFGSAYWLVELILLLASVGIYLGRTLRLNSWDVVARPARVVQDVVQVTVHPSALAALTTVTFFALLSAVYAAAWWPLGKEQSPKAKR